MILPPDSLPVFLPTRLLAHTSPCRPEAPTLALPSSLPRGPSLCPYLLTPSHPMELVFPALFHISQHDR